MAGAHVVKRSMPSRDLSDSADGYIRALPVSVVAGQPDRVACRMPAMLLMPAPMRDTCRDGDFCGGCIERHRVQRVRR